MVPVETRNPGCHWIGTPRRAAWVWTAEPRNEGSSTIASTSALAAGVDPTKIYVEAHIHGPITLGAFDEFLADLIAEGTHEGLAAAKARGRTGGRPTVVTPAKLAIARDMLQSGDYTATEVARTVGIGRTNLYRHLEAAPAQ